MADIETIEVSKALATTKSKTRTLATGIPIRVRNVGGASSGTVTVTTNVVTLTDDATTSYELDFESTYTSVGLLTDAIESKEGWEAIPEDSYRGQTLGVGYLLVAGAASATGSQGVALTSTTTTDVIVASLQHTAFLANDNRDTDKVFANEGQHINFTATNATSTNTLSIYAVSDTADELLYSEALTATTDLQEPVIQSLIERSGFKAGYGKRLVVAVTQSTAGGTLNLIGETYRASPVNA